MDGNKSNTNQFRLIFKKVFTPKYSPDLFLEVFSLKPVEFDPGLRPTAVTLAFDGSQQSKQRHRLRCALRGDLMDQIGANKSIFWEIQTKPVFVYSVLSYFPTYTISFGGWICVSRWLEQIQVTCSGTRSQARAQLRVQACSKSGASPCASARPRCWRTLTTGMAVNRRTTEAFERGHLPSHVPGCALVVNPSHVYNRMYQCLHGVWPLLSVHGRGLYREGTRSVTYSGTKVRSCMGRG